MSRLSNRRVVQRAVTSTTDLASGGILNTAQASRFIQMLIDPNQMMPLVRTVTMDAPVQDFDKISVASRIARGMTESDATHVNFMRQPTHGKVTLTAKKVGLPWGITEEAKKDNIEGEAYEDRLARLMTEQLGADLEDYAINGDTVYTGSAPATTVNMAGNIDGTTDPIDIVAASLTGFPRTGTAGWLLIDSEYFLYEYLDTATSTFKYCHRAQNGSTIATHLNGAAITFVRHALIGHDDGWLKKLYAGTSSAHYTDLSAINSGDLIKDHFFTMERSLPVKYRRGSARARLRWFMSPYQVSIWREYLTNRGTPAGDAPLTGKDAEALKPLGIPIVDPGAWPEDSIVLADPMNFMFGIWAQIKIKSTDMDKDSVMQDETYYNVTTRVDTEVQETDAVAYGDGLNYAVS